jgi:dTDP-4-dehydrorhamnose reductase
MSEKVLILGVSGMLGHTCFGYFNGLDEYETYGTWRKPADGRIRTFDASTDSVADIINEIKPDWIINCIGVIKQKIDERNRISVDNTLKLNQFFPYEIARSVAGSRIKVIQIATDCVFNGVKGGYSEISPHDAIDLYGKSKSQGEVLSLQFLNLRVSIIGKEIESNYSLVSWFLSQKIGAEIEGYTNHLWNGITTQAFARIASGIILNHEFVCGTFNVVPSDQVSKYQLLQHLGKHFDREDISIKPFNTPIPIDRTLCTTHPNFNETLWRNAGYRAIPSVEELIEDLASNF